jgi:hypothetical protein
MADASARERHVPTCAGQMETGPMANGSSEAEEHGGVARLRVELFEVDRFKFEKSKSKIFRNMTEQPMSTIGGGEIRTMGDGRGANKANIER